MMPLGPTSTQTNSLYITRITQLLLYTHNFMVNHHTLFTTKGIRNIIRKNFDKKIITIDSPILPVVFNTYNIPSVTHMKILSCTVTGAICIIGYIELKE